MRPVFGLLVGLLASACSGVGAPVPVSGDTGILEGEWEGTYSSDQSGRSGHIFFWLDTGTDTARGEVVMYPPSAQGISAPFDRSGPPEIDRPRSEVLNIRFIRAEGGIVNGRLEPYRDPQCGCQLTTVFRGILKGDTLSGSFRSWHEEMQRWTEGTWHTVRKAK